MGCDGGSIPRRDELVKLKKKEEKADPAEVERIRWSSCAISKEPLKDPIVTCELGFLYNKDAVIRQLLEKTMDEAFGHIRSLKDLIPVRFTPNSAFAEKEKSGEDNVAPFTCPITLTEVGRSRFSLIKTCGCALSERALREVPSTTCLQCGKPFTANDILPLNPPQEELDELRKAMLERRAAERSEKRKSKKEKKGKKKEKDVKVDGADGKADGKGGSSEEEKAEKASKIKSILSEREALKKRTLDTTATTTTTSTSEPAAKVKKSDAYASIFTSSIKPAEGRMQETFMCRNVLRN